MKLISPKLRIVIFASVFAALIFVIIVNFQPSCSVKYLQIIDEIKKYETELDPDICDYVLEKIDSFNDSCNEKIEPLDCG